MFAHKVCLCVHVVCGWVSDLLKLSLPLLGLRLQLRDTVLGVLQLALEPPDHVVQGVEPWAPQNSQAVLGTQLLLPQPTLWHHHRFSQLLGGCS